MRRLAALLLASCLLAGCAAGRSVTFGRRAGKLAAHRG